MDAFVPHLLAEPAVPVMLLLNSLGNSDVSRLDPASPQTRQAMEALQKMALYHQTAEDLGAILNHFSYQAGHGIVEGSNAVFHGSASLFTSGPSPPASITFAHAPV